MKFGLKNYFVILIGIIILLFLSNILYSNKTIKSKNINLFDEKLDKATGIKIQRKNSKGETLFVEAEELNEDKKNKRLSLKNSTTNIDKNGEITTITSGEALITDNFKKFNFLKKVEIINKSKKFFLKTNSISGEFNKGSMFSENDVYLIINDKQIVGKGIQMHNHGEYIKIIGKAKMTSKSND